MASFLKAGAGKLAEVTGVAPPPAKPKDWQTRIGQCDPPAETQDWLLSIFCTQCASAVAKSNQDKTHPCFNFMCWTPIISYSWVRKGYGIPGVCGDDLMCAIFCSCCTTRRIYTEARDRKEIQRPLGNDKWKETLFGCDCPGFFYSMLCAPCAAHKIRNILQPDREASCCYDCMCNNPFAMYGQVRHTYGIVGDCGTQESAAGVAEDIFLPVVCQPCALDQALREARFRATQQPAARVANAAAGALGLGAFMK